MTKIESNTGIRELTADEIASISGADGKAAAGADPIQAIGTAIGNALVKVANTALSIIHMF